MTSGQRAIFAAVVCALLALVVAAAPRPPRQATRAVVRRAATTKFGANPALPGCLTLSVESGDPTTGPATMLLHFAPGCGVPWHFHSVNETLFGVSGSVRLSMRDGNQATMFSHGDYAMMPARQVHMARCATAGPCVAFLQSDGIFDIHYVDSTGKEIPLAEALKPVGGRHGAR